jgi:iron complex transport system substrate-binding protein
MALLKRRAATALAAALLAPLTASAVVSPPRVVSLAPSFTELVYELGAGSRLVGTVAFSRRPPAARRLPRVGSAFGYDVSRILALRPTVVLAWRGGTPPVVVAELRRLGLRVVWLGTTSLRGLPHEIRRVGRIVGRPREGRRLAGRVRALLERLRRRAPRRRLRVFYEISAHPLYTVGSGSMLGRAIGWCGGRNIFGAVAWPPAFAVGHAAVLARDPEVIVASGRHARRRLDAWRRDPDLAAVRAGRLEVLPSGFAAAPSLRFVAALAVLCRDLRRAAGAGSRASPSLPSGRQESGRARKEGRRAG